MVSFARMLLKLYLERHSTCAGDRDESHDQRTHQDGGVVERQTRADVNHHSAKPPSGLLGFSLLWGLSWSLSMRFSRAVPHASKHSRPEPEGDDRREQQCPTRR